MRKSWTSCAIALLFFATSAFAQANGGGKPTTPPGQAPAPAAQQVVDSAGTVVGEVLKLEANGLANVSIKYPLPDGDYVVLSVNHDAIAPFGQSGTSNPIGFGLANAKVFFTTADCSGDAYLFQPGPTQLTRRQALILDGVDGFDEVPWDGSCAPQPAGGRTLYASDPLACWRPILPGSQMTFQAYYGVDPMSPATNSACVTVQGGVSLPGPENWRDVYKIYRRIEDLDQKFDPPFYIP